MKKIALSLCILFSHTGVAELPHARSLIDSFGNLLQATNPAIPQDNEALLENINKVETSFLKSHEFLKKSAAVGVEPLIKALREDFTSAREATESRLGTSLVAKEIRASCTTCHYLMTSNHPKTSVSIPAGLNRVEVVDFLVATLRYADARAFIETELSHAKTPVIERIDLLERLLAISVTHLSSSYSSRPFADALASNQIAENLTERVKGWISASKRLSSYEHPERAFEVLRKQSQRPVAPLTGSEEVRLLASLRSVLSGYYDFYKERHAETLYLIGTALAHLDGFFPRELSETFFKKCISDFSVSRYAPLCYTRLKESVLFRYTGSAGTKLSPIARRQLAKLKSKIAPRE